MLLTHLVLRIPIRIPTIHLQRCIPAVIKRDIKQDSLMMIKRTSTASEVIYDSEPEREELRRKKKEERPKRRPFFNNVDEEHKLLELRKSSGQKVSDKSGRVKASPSMIMLQNDQVQFQSDRCNDVETLSVIDITDDEIPLVVSKRAVPADSPTIVNVVSSDSETEPEGQNNMGLSRFTYQNPSRSQLIPGLSRTSSNVMVENSSIHPTHTKKTTRTTGQHRFTADFSEAGLRGLIKCVCCGERWTTRKGVAQKMAHIQSCAKKNALTDATIKILIRQEVDKVLAENPINTAKGKGKAVNPEDILPGGSQTYMEDVVRGAEPKKRGRRPEGVQSVKSVTESVEVIRDRARAVLGNHILPNTQEIDDRRQTQAFGPSRLLGQVRRDFGTSNDHPATQAFGRSALGQRQASSSGLNIFSGTFQKDPVDVDGEASILPSTQSFGPSKLGGLHRLSKDPVCRSLQSPKLASPSPYINLVSSSSKDLSPRPSLRMNTENDDCTLMHRRTPSLQYLDTPPLTLNLISNRQAGESEPCNIYREPPEFYENDFPWDGGDAFLHFDPHIGGQNQYQSTYIAGDQMVYSDESNIRQGTYTKSTETGKPRKSKTRKASPSEHSDVSSIKTKKTAVKAKGKQRMVNDDDPLLDENWEAQLKASIIQDNALHLRILRFEPIHFEVFLRKATDKAKPSGRLKYALRSFLDRQAINFYGAEPTSRGR